MPDYPTWTLPRRREALQWTLEGEVQRRLAVTRYGSVLHEVPHTRVLHSRLRRKATGLSDVSGALSPRYAVYRLGRGFKKSFEPARCKKAGSRVFCFHPEIAPNKVLKLSSCPATQELLGRLFDGSGADRGCPESASHRTTAGSVCPRQGWPRMQRLRARAPAPSPYGDGAGHGRLPGRTRAGRPHVCVFAQRLLLPRGSFHAGPRPACRGKPVRATTSVSPYR